MVVNNKKQRDLGKKELSPALHSKTTTGSQAVHAIAFWALAALLFLPPFFRGLFFAPEQQKALFFAVLVFWLVWIWKWVRRDHSFLSHPLDYFMLAFPLTYILAGLNAANYGLAVDEAVEVALYFIVYWCVVQLVRNRKDTERLLYVIYVSAVGVALAGLMTATGLINIKDGLQGDRIASFLQYPNALAGYLVVVLAVGLYLWLKSAHFTGKHEEQIGKTKIDKCVSYLFAAGNYLLAAVIIGAKSSGGFIVLTLAALMILLFLPGWRRLFALLHMMTVTVPAAAGMHFFIENVMEHQYARAWLWLLPGFLLVIFLQWLYLKYVSSLQQKGVYYRAAVAGVVCLVLLGSALSLARADKLPGVAKVVKIQSLMDRFYFVGDAVKMIEERPLSGWGGGGWQEAYRSYQSYSYNSNQVHSHYTQVAVETGVTGLLVVAGIWLVFMLSGCRAYRKNEDINDRTFIAIIGAGTIATGVHAAADFNLSLSAVSLVLYTLMAVVRNADDAHTARERPWTGNKKGFIKAPFLLAPSAGLVIIIFVSCLMTAGSYAGESGVFLKQGKLDMAIADMEKAATYNPFRAEYHGALAELYAYAGKKDAAHDHAVESMKKSKYNAVNRHLMARLAIDRGDFNNASRLAGEAVELAPWVIENYEFAGMIYKFAGLAELKNNRPAEAYEYFAAAAHLPGRIRDRINALDSNKQKRNEYFHMTPKIALAAGVGFLLTGNFDEANKNLALAVQHDNTRGETLVWLAVLSEKLGDAKSASSYLNSAGEISPKNEKIYKEIKSILQ